MEAQEAPATPVEARPPWTHWERAYALAIFVAALVALRVALERTTGFLSDHDSTDAVFFLVYGLFTIAVGYQHPRFGYYSFDRVAQVASILVLGPLDAAWVNGLASFIYPWHRLWKNVPFIDVLFAALNNSGLMTLIILASGYLYVGLGGEIPLTALSAATVPFLIGLVLVMQLLNDVGMFGLLLVGRHDTRGFFHAFSFALELGSGATAVLVALVYNGTDTATLALLLGVLSVGMLALRQFANMRNRLEAIVEERTRSLREKSRELELQATQDNLTGLYNRRYADNYLNQQLDTSKRYGQRFTIALADIDLFKQINDLHSHATGDEVLRRVARILLERCRKTDMIARYGGEEFLICFPATDVGQAHALCEQLRLAIESEDWSQLSLRAGVTTSFGLAERRPGLSLRDLLDMADLRLYAAKNGGRNLVVA
jgi:diguanylate cyclase (GGDEF)-like protein